LEQQPVYIKLLTNGTFPLDHCKDVIRGDSVVINFSAVDRQQYHDLQGKDLFDRVVANIERLVSLRDTGKPGFRIEIVYVVNAGNVDQKQKMRDLASRLGVHVVSFQKMSVNAYNQGIALPEGPGEREGKRISPICLKGWFYAGADPVTATICCRTFQMSLDDLDKASFKQFWFSPRMMKMRLLGKHGRIQEISKACQTCPFYDEDT
jgi:MoaA/NifB/PqqE/SkfB family radical SAM enzyme